MLGSAFLKHSSHEVCAPGITSPRVDIRDYNTIKADVERCRPDAILNFVAICDMEKCETDPAEAVRVNTQGSANSALVALCQDIDYAYVSSACVFDGEKYAYSVNDRVCPVSVYGKTKLMGEVVAQTVPKHFIVRSEWCFGGGPNHDAKFIGKIFRQIAEGKTEIIAVGDKVGSLSYTPDLCKGIDKVLENKQYGTYHICCEGTASRYEVACEFVRLLGLENKVQVQNAESSAFSKEYFAPRPKSERLINSVIPGFKARDWQVCLAEYAKEFRGE